MMANPIFKEYMEKVNNQEENYKRIMAKKKGVVPMKISKRKIINVAAIFMVIVFVAVASTKIYAKIQWDIEFKEFQSKPEETTRGALEESKENGYSEIINMDYVTQDGVSSKVESLMLTDDCLDANISFKFAEDKVVNSETFSYSYAVYDENKNIYAVSSRMMLDPNIKIDRTTEFIYKELGVDIHTNMLADGHTIGNEKVDPESKTILSNINLRAGDQFPRSKKIYIKVFNLGYYMIDLEAENKLESIENFQITDAQWIFEIDVPDKFYERNTIELKLQDEIPGFTLNKATLTESGMVIKFQSKEYVTLISEGKDMPSNEFSKARDKMFFVSDGEEKIYFDLGGGTTGEDGYKMRLNAGKKDLDKKLYINFNDGKTQYKSELVRK